MFNNKLIGSSKVQTYGESIGGFLVQWGAHDHNGNIWNEDTDFHLDWYGHYPLLFANGRHPEVGLEQIGTVYYTRHTTFGLMVMGVLDPECKWYEALCVLKDKGTLAWTGSPIQHLTKIKDGIWTHYPMAEFSLIHIKDDNPPINQLESDKPDPEIDEALIERLTEAAIPWKG